MKTIPIALALAASLATGSAAAQRAGGITAEIGFTHLAPQVDSGELSAPAFPNTRSDVGSATALSGAVTYMVTDNFALNLPLGLGFKHEITGAGRADGFGKLAEVRVLPITLLGQYRFGAAEAQWRPYVGGGLTYAKFYDETGSGALTALTNPGGTPTTLSVDSKLGLTLQLGVIFNVNERWYVNAHYIKTFLKTDANFSTGQTQSIRLDPNAYSLAVGYKF